MRKDPTRGVLPERKRTQIATQFVLARMGYFDNLPAVPRYEDMAPKNHVP